MIGNSVQGVRERENCVSDNLLHDLQFVCQGQLEMDASLQALSRWKVGGRARCLIRPTSAQQLVAILEILKQHACNFLVIGSTTNLLFSDDGLSGVTLQIGQAMSRFMIEGQTVSCDAGAWVPGFARKLALAGLSGAEHIAGIPGTLGGLICMNGGSQRKGIGDSILDVTTVNRAGECQSYSREQCGFEYRTSRFQRSGEIITGATFRFAPKDPALIRRELLSILRSRRAKFPQKLPNCGSVFVSDPAMYADYGPPGKVIEDCELKGMVYGNAQISPIHANFIVNLGGARASDILYLIHHARTQVKNHTGYDMRAEAIYVEPNGVLVPAHIKAEQVFA